MPFSQHLKHCFQNAQVFLRPQAPSFPLLCCVEWFWWLAFSTWSSTLVSKLTRFVFHGSEKSFNLQFLHWIMLIIYFTFCVSLSGSFHSVFTCGPSGDSAPPATVCSFFGLLHHGHAGNVVCFRYHRWTLQHSRNSLQAKWEVGYDLILFVPRTMICRHARRIMFQ